VGHHVAALRPGGLMVAIDFDLGGARVEPPLELAATALAWCEAAFRRAGADPRIGARLASLLGGAGLRDVGTFGVQGYLAAADPLGPALLAGIVRSLAPAIVAGGIATAEEIGADTLEQRLAAALAASGSVAFLPPTVVGAWGRR
jgi:hypothetical protein